MRMDEYIPIDSVDDLDPSKISLKDINKKYIDRNGMRYATRFNLKTRKVEIVRIVKGRQEAEMIRRQVVQHRAVEQRSREEARDYSNDGEGLGVVSEDEFGGFPSTPEPFSGGSAAPAGGGARSLPDMDASAGFVERQFIDECASDFEKVKERLQGIMNFIKNSRYFETHRSEGLNEAFRMIDVDGIQRSEAAINHYKELMSYPRPVSYYISRMAADLKSKLDAVAGDDEKMVFVRRWEIQAVFTETYDKVKTTTENLLTILNGVPGEDLDLLPHNQRQAFDDARAASTFLLENCVNRLERIRIWKHKFG